MHSGSRLTHGGIHFNWKSGLSPCGKPEYGFGHHRCPEVAKSPCVKRKKGERNRRDHWLDGFRSRCFKSCLMGLQHLCGTLQAPAGVQCTKRDTLELLRFRSSSASSQGCRILDRADCLKKK